MFDISKLKTATINDIIFYCTSVNNLSGIKWVIDELPLSGRAINYNGIIEDIFEINGQIEYENWSKLKKIFNTGAEATITLPYHTDNVLVFIELKKTEIFTKNSIGLVNFEIICYVSKISSNQILNVNDFSNILNGKEDLRNSIVAFIQDVNSFTSETIGQVRDKINNFAITIKESAVGIQSFTDPFTNFLQSIDTLQASITDLLRTPEIMATNLSNIFTSFEQIATTTIEQFEMAKNVLTTNYFDIIFKTSQIKEEQYNAINPINQYIWADCMNIAIYNASQSDFETQEDLIEAKNFINNQYNKYSQYFTDNAEILIKMQTQIARMNLLLNQKQVNLPVLQKVFYPFTNPYNISYELYGNIDNVDKIMQLNKITDYTNINQEINVYL
jgi:hypothetical protein